MAKQLSIFIDESGDFGTYQVHSPYYLVTMVFHNQENDIKSAVQALDEHLRMAGYETHALHTGPLIRREEYYRELKIDERRKLLGTLMNFLRHVDVSYKTLCADKQKYSGVIELTGNLAKQIRELVDNHLEYFQSFDEIIVYYDSGQIELTRTLTSSLGALLLNVEFRKVKPSEYKLFQLADMICTMELIALKFEKRQTSKTEIEFFNGQNKFNKDYFKKIKQRQLK